MNANDTLPPIETPEGGAGAAGDGAGDVWPTNGPAKGLRVRLPVAVASLAVVALVGAAAGAALKPSSSTSVQARATFGNPAAGAAVANGVPGANGGRLVGPGGGIVGTITKVEGNKITVTQRDGTTATVVTSSDTTVSKTVSGSQSDLTPGTTIAVRGTTADGQTTAQNITVNPANGAGPVAVAPPPSG